MRLKSISSNRIINGLAIAALVAVGLVAVPATVGAVPAAEADEVTCSQLALGKPCTVSFEEHPEGHTTIHLPPHLTTVTVMLAGAAGAPGDDGHAPGGPGGITIASIDVTEVAGFEAWLGQAGSGRDGGGLGWAPGGDGGDWNVGNGGHGGGAASGLSFLGVPASDPVLVAGGGGGGAGNGSGGFDVYKGGAGGWGGLPPGDGVKGAGEVWGEGGTGGSESSNFGGDGGGTDNPIAMGSAGGGGGGGYHGGEGGDAAHWRLHFGYSTGGGGGGGSSYVSPDATYLGSGAWPHGSGWVTIMPGEPTIYECNGSSERRELPVPHDVLAYQVVAVGGAGSPGSNTAEGGHGGVVTGYIDVQGIDMLHYWVGCSGQAGDASGHGYGYSGAGGTSSVYNNGGRGGGATALSLADGTMLIAAGGGGGAGGDLANCFNAPGPMCGGNGGSSGGAPNSALPPDGAWGDGGVGGAGGTANSNTDNGQPDPSGADGGSGAPADLAGGGGGGGAGYPSGGGGGAHYGLRAGGGGGAGGSYFNPHYVDHGTIATSGAEANENTVGNGYLLLVPVLDTRTDLTIRKSVEGEGSIHAQGPFTMHLVCTVGSETPVDVTFELDGDGEHTQRVPIGADCTITETGTGGASFPAVPQQVTVGDGPSTITMANVFDLTTLDLAVRSQVLDEGGQPTTDVTLQPGSYGVAVACTLDGHELALPAPVVNGMVTIDGDATFTGAGVTVSIQNVPSGALCTVTEQPDAHATSVAYTADGSPSGPGETFLLDGGGSTVEIDNTYQLAALDLEKTVGGNGDVPDGAEFSGTVTCTFAGAPVTFGTPRTFEGLTPGQTVTVHDLPIGAHCTVTETETAGATAVVYAPTGTVLIQPSASHVTIANIYDANTLVVRANATGAGLHWANQDLSLHVVCTLADVTMLDETFTTPPGGGWRSYAVDENAVCTVTEEITGGATSVAYSSSADGTASPTPVEVTVGAEPVSLDVDNVFEAAALDVSVTPSGDGVAFADPSTVTVRDCTFNGADIQIAGGATSIPFGFPAAGGSSGVPQLVVGAECVVELTDTGGATSATEQVTNGDPTSTNGLAVTVTLTGPATEVAFATVFDVAGLDVQKVVTGPGAWASNTTFEVEVTCTLDGTPIDQLGQDGAVTLQFEPDGTPIDSRGRTALGTLPVGASCAVEETEDGGATTVAVDTNPVVLGSEDATVTVENTFGVGTVTVTKTVAGNDAASHVDDAFGFQLGCTFNGQALGNPPTDPQATTFHLADGGSATFLDRPAGALCTVLEFETREATSVTPDVQQVASVTDGQDAVLAFTNTFDVATLTITEALTGPGADTYGQPLTFEAWAQCTYADGSNATLPTGNQVLLNEANSFTQDLLAPIGSTCTAWQPMFYATSQTVSAPVDILLGDEHTITITSDYEVGELTVSKTAVGNFDPAQEFGFAVVCTWPTAPPPVDAPLEPGPVTIPLNGDEPGEFELRSSQSRVMAVLSGATCTSTETAAVGALRTVSEATGPGAVSGDASAVVVPLVDEAGAVAVTNYMPGSLPVTGSELGMAGLVALALLLLGAAIVVVRRRLLAATRS